MKRIVNDKFQPPYSLHDMNIIAFEVSGDDIILRTQSGIVQTVPPYGQHDGYVELHDIRWEYSCAYLLHHYGNFGTFTGEKLSLRDLIDRHPVFGFSVMDTTYCQNIIKLDGFLSANRALMECIVEIYYEGDMVFVDEEMIGGQPCPHGAE